MYKQLRGPERLFKFGQWIVAALFAFFLIKVGSSLIADLPLLAKYPQQEEYLDEAAIRNIEVSIKPSQDKISILEKSMSQATEELEIAQADYLKSKESFDNWRITRSSTEQSEQNPEVIAKARKLDILLKEQQQIESKVRNFEQAKNDLEALIKPQFESTDHIREEAERKYRDAVYQADLKAFFIRLLFVIPLLAISIWLFRRYRKSQNWPFVWGFILFSLFAFFFELVPYLPSFGGYIRYGVGAILTFLGGKAIIRSLQQYLERKSQEQAAPQEERKQDIQYEKALESISRGQCPSCERVAMPKNIEGTLINFCMHCGLKIFEVCAQCGFRHNAFYPFCPSCGMRTEKIMAKGDK